MPTMSPFEAAFCRSAPWRAFTRRVVLPWAMQGITPSGEVLEIGAGSGTMAAEVLAAYPHIRMTVTDYDDAMVTTAERRLIAFAERVVVRQADATRLPFDDARFDNVLSFIMLHHAVRWEAALAEAARVLRPGGQLVGYDLLASWPTRALHQAQRVGQRMMRLDELRTTLGGLPFTDLQLRTGLGGLVVRFRTTRTGA